MAKGNYKARIEGNTIVVSSDLGEIRFATAEIFVNYPFTAAACSVISFVHLGETTGLLKLTVQGPPFTLYRIEYRLSTKVNVRELLHRIGI